MVYNRRVVLAPEDNGKQKRLVAYVVPSGQVAKRQGEGVDATVLRTALQQRLPDYMIPARLCLPGRHATHAQW